MQPGATSWVFPGLHLQDPVVLGPSSQNSHPAPSPFALPIPVVTVTLK